MSTMCNLCPKYGKSTGNKHGALNEVRLQSYPPNIKISFCSLYCHFHGFENALDISYVIYSTRIHEMRAYSKLHYSHDTVWPWDTLVH